MDCFSAGKVIIGDGTNLVPFTYGARIFTATNDISNNGTFRITILPEHIRQPGLLVVKMVVQLMNMHRDGGSNSYSYLGSNIKL